MEPNQELNIRINGETRDVSASWTLADLVDHLKLAAERVAIELNHDVIRRAHWRETLLHEGDRVEIVHFVGGGSGRRKALKSSEF